MRTFHHVFMTGTILPHRGVRMRGP
jgi:hypothetical protein